SVIPVIIIALFSGSFLGSLLKAGIVFAIVQFIDGSITGPRITGSAVGLHPGRVLLALAVGGYFFGFVGILLAMPAAVLVKLSLIRALKRYRASALYNEPEIETELGAATRRGSERRRAPPRGARRRPPPPPAGGRRTGSREGR